MNPSLCPYRLYRARLKISFAAICAIALTACFAVKKLPPPKTTGSALPLRAVGTTVPVYVFLERDDVEVGVHFCYGDPGHKHLVEPKNTALMVEIGNGLVAASGRQMTWLHVPVPRNRDDDAYFAPLKNLRRKPGTELYLGLVHRTDGIEGAKRRLAAAKKVLSDFGVATECGLARRPRETIAELLTLHRRIAELG